MPDGRCGTPCGACKELMIQIMPNGKYKKIEIMLNYSSNLTIKLGESTPNWWIK